MARLQGKYAVVVGASSGLGREVARLLLEQGWTVGVAARRSDRLDDLCRQWPDRAVAATLDVRDNDAPQRLTELVSRLGGLDLYFHAAGIGWHNPALDANRELATVDTNATGFTRLIDTAFTIMAEGKGGHIAAITSVAGTKGLGAAPAYSATKAFQSTYLQAIEQLAHLGRLPITVSDLRPGFVATDLLAGKRYPLLMQPAPTARRLLNATLKRRRTAIVDTRWRLLTALWRRMPRWLWTRLPIQ